METGIKIVEWYQMVSYDSIYDCVKDSAKKIGLDLVENDLYSRIDDDNWLDYNILRDTAINAVLKQKLWAQYTTDLHVKLSKLRINTFFAILQKLLVLETKESKEHFISDVYTAVTFLKWDQEYFQGSLGSVAGSDDPQSILCKKPIEIYYWDKLGLSIFELLDHIEKRFSNYILESAKKELEQQFTDHRATIGSYIKMQNNDDDQKNNAPFILTWNKSDGDLIELVTALSIAECVKTSNGKVSRTQLANAFASIFGLEKFTDSTITDRANKNLRRKIESAKFLVDLLEAYKKVSEKKKNIPSKKSSS